MSELQQKLFDQSNDGTLASAIRHIGETVDPLSAAVCEEAAFRVVVGAEMYAALKELSLNIGAASLSRNPYGKELRAKAAAAIAKAEGRS